MTVVLPPYLVPGRIPDVVLADLHPVNETRGRANVRNMVLQYLMIKIICLVKIIEIRFIINLINLKNTRDRWNPLGANFAAELDILTGAIGAQWRRWSFECS